MSERSIDHALDLMLEERLGGRTPPDLSERIRAAAVRDRPAPGHSRRSPRARMRRSIRMRWWMVPVLVVLGLLGLLLFFPHSGLAPFVYTMF